MCNCEPRQSRRGGIQFGGKGNEICNECGYSVAWGSGNFVNRVPACNDIETRREMGKPFPEGDYICAECDSHRNCDNCGDSTTEKYTHTFDNGDTEYYCEFCAMLLKIKCKHEWLSAKIPCELHYYPNYESQYMDVDRDVGNLCENKWYSVHCCQCEKDFTEEEFDELFGMFEWESGFMHGKLNGSRTPKEKRGVD